MDKKTKQRKLSQLMIDNPRFANISQEDAAAIATAVRERPDIGSLHRMSFVRSHRHLFASVAYTEVLPSQADPNLSIDWELADPSRLMQLTMSKCPKLQAVYGRALAKHPCSPDAPWRLIIGFDEFVPGNKLKVDNSKKVMNLSFNFVEVGHTALAQVATWFVQISVRHQVVTKVRGGWSFMIAKFLERMFLGVGGFATAGVPIEVNGGVALIFASLNILISDGDGLRLAFSWRGASSLKPCLKHGNVVKLGSDLASRARGCVEISCHEPHAFHRTTTTEFYDSTDLVEAATERFVAGTMRKQLYDRLVKCEGLNYVEGGLPFNAALRNAGIDLFGAARFDWVHSALSTPHQPHTENNK